MPPPIPLSSAAARYSAGSQSGSASSSANDGLMASQASAGDDAPAIVAWTRATNALTTRVSRRNSPCLSPDDLATQAESFTRARRSLAGKARRPPSMMRPTSPRAMLRANEHRGDGGDPRRIEGRPRLALLLAMAMFVVVVDTSLM